MTAGSIVSSSFHTFRTRLLVGCAAILLLLVVGQVWKVNADYRAEIQTTIAQTNNLVLAIEAHVIDVIDTMNAPLTAVADTIAQRSTNGAIPAQEIKSLLTTPLLPPSANYWLTYIDANGNGVAASNDLPVGGVSFSEREYFSVQKKQIRNALFVGNEAFANQQPTQNLKYQDNAKQHQQN